MYRKRKETEKQESKIPVFTKRFREIFENSEDSAVKFAERTGISRQAINSYLNENRVPDSIALKKICSAYNVSADWLLGLSEAKKRDATLDAAIEYTGLSEKAIETIHQLSSREKEFIALHPEEGNLTKFKLALDRIISADQNTLITMLCHIVEAWDSYERYQKEIQPYSGNDLMITAMKMNYHDQKTGNIVLSTYQSAEFCLSQAAECFKAICKLAKDGES